MLTDEEIEAIPYKAPGDPDMYVTHTTAEMMKWMKVNEPMLYKQMLAHGMMEEYYPEEDFYWLMWDYNRAISFGVGNFPVDCNLFTDEEILSILEGLKSSIEISQRVIENIDEKLKNTSYFTNYLTSLSQMQKYQKKLEQNLQARVSAIESSAPAQPNSN